jgi:hypothetical protein
MLPCLQINSPRLEFLTRCIFKAWMSLLHHIHMWPSLSLCSMLIPPPSCCSCLMPQMASTQPSHMAAQPGLMPCIPIGLFEPHVSLFLPVFFFLLSILFPSVLYFICSHLSNIWIGDTMPLCFPSHKLYSVHTMVLFGYSIN